MKNYHLCHVLHPAYYNPWFITSVAPWFITSDEKNGFHWTRSFRQQSLFLISLDCETKRIPLKFYFSKFYLFLFQSLSFTCFNYLYLSALIQVVVFLYILSIQVFLTKLRPYFSIVLTFGRKVTTLFLSKLLSILSHILGNGEGKYNRNGSF